MSLQHQLEHNTVLRHALASEYVLGLLRGGARRRFESWLPGNAALQHAVSEWQNRLHPMVELAPEIAPPARVWSNIAGQLRFGAQAQRKNAPVAAPPTWWRALSESLSFWRNVGLTSTVLATLLIAVLLTRQVDTSAPAGASYVATLSDDKSQPVLLVTSDIKRGELVVKVIARQTLADNNSLQLWAIPKEGAPRSLGVLPAARAGDVIRLALPAQTTPESIPLLAISLEPKGGSPDPNGPTGPVLYKGAWLQI